MKKNKKDNNEEKMVDKMIDLCLWYQIEDSNTSLKVMEDQVKILEERRKCCLINLINVCLIFKKEKSTMNLRK